MWRCGQACPGMTKSGKKNCTEMGFFNYFEKLSLFFAKYALKQKLILLSIFLYKVYIWKNCCSWAVAEKALNQSDCRILIRYISWWNYWVVWVFCMKTDNVQSKIERNCVRRWVKSWSFTKNSIEWKTK